MALIACARMYNVTGPARQAWARLFERIGQSSGVALRVIDHAAPAPLESLWKRPDLGCAFMCGWPFSRADPRPQLLAAPLPLGARYGGRPVYFTDLVVRRDRAYKRLEDTFGGRIGWTAEGSHSGFNAPRHLLLTYRSAGRPRLYGESLGPAVTPAAMLSWVVEGKVDVGPLDSYALDLIRRHEAARAAAIAVIGSTVASPIPPLVAAAGVDSATVTALRRALLGAARDEELAPVLAALGLAGFAAVDPHDYDVTRARAEAALTAGYAFPE